MAHEKELSDQWDSIIGAGTPYAGLTPSRDVLPISTGRMQGDPVRVLPGQQCVIKSKPLVPYKPERMFASSSLALSDWQIDDIKIDGVSRLPRSISATHFGTSIQSDRVNLEQETPDQALARTWCDGASFSKAPIEVVVTYTGSNTEGVPYFGAMIGIALREPKAAMS